MLCARLGLRTERASVLIKQLSELFSPGYLARSGPRSWTPSADLSRSNRPSETTPARRRALSPRRPFHPVLGLHLATGGSPLQDRRGIDIVPDGVVADRRERGRLMMRSSSRRQILGID